MKDHPIIFSAAMVVALLAGRKTQTRRLASSPLRKAAPGDRLWVRESGRELSYAFNHGTDRDEWAICGFKYSADGTIIYSDGEWHDSEKSRPSIHMLRMFSRLTLVVTEVRLERLRDITEDDAWAEGVTDFAESLDQPGLWEGLSEEDRRAIVRVQFGGARQAFQCLWESLHGAGSWAANPALIALTFSVHQVNIDQMPARAA